MDLSVVDISSAIIRKVKSIKHSTEYLYLGVVFSFLLALLPALFRAQFNGSVTSLASAAQNSSEIVDLLNFTFDLDFLWECIFSSTSDWRYTKVCLFACGFLF